MAWMMTSWLALGLGLGAAEPEKDKGPVTLARTEVKGTVTAGARLTVVLHFKLAGDFHAQAHRPSEEFFIPTVLKLDPPAGVRVGELAYPEGVADPVPGLDKPMRVYAKEFAVTVPLALSPRTQLPATVKGTLRYQACQGAVCYPPRDLPVAFQLEEKAE